MDMNNAHQEWVDAVEATAHERKAHLDAMDAVYVAVAALEAWLELRDVFGVDSKVVTDVQNNYINAVKHASNLALQLGYYKWSDLL
jgi:hypothetical protein